MTANELSQKMHKQFADGLQAGYAMAQQPPMPAAAFRGVPPSARFNHGSHAFGQRRRRKPRLDAFGRARPFRARSFPRLPVNA
eukprot:2678892-Pleurochrysis_carterae.AAC.4